MKTKFFVPLIFAFFACKTPKIMESSKSESNLISSTVDSIVTRDTAITTPPSTVHISIPFRVDPDGTLVAPPKDYAVSGNATVKYTILRDTIFVEANCDSITTIITKHYEARYRAMDSVSVANSHKVEVKRELYIPKVVKILAWIGGITVTFLGFKAFKRITTFI
jgi:hypothetical protein